MLLFNTFTNSNSGCVEWDSPQLSFQIWTRPDESHAAIRSRCLRLKAIPVRPDRLWVIELARRPCDPCFCACAWEGSSSPAVGASRAAIGVDMGEVMSYRYSRPSADPAANTPGLVGLNCIPVMEENAPLAPERENKEISTNQNNQCASIRYHNSLYSMNNIF